MPELQAIKERATGRFIISKGLFPVSYYIHTNPILVRLNGLK